MKLPIHPAIPGKNLIACIYMDAAKQLAKTVRREREKKTTFEPPLPDLNFRVRDEISNIQKKNGIFSTMVQLFKIKLIFFTAFMVSMDKNAFLMNTAAVRRCTGSMLETSTHKHTHARVSCDF